MNKLIDFLILITLSFLIGFNISLSYIIAPILFSNLDHRTAGEIMNLIFPYYFASGWIGGIFIYTLIGIKSIKNKNLLQNLKGFIVGILLLVIFHMALHKTILPIARDINVQYYQALDNNRKEAASQIKKRFKKIHTVSSVINLLNLAIELYLFQYYLNRSSKLKNASV